MVCEKVMTKMLDVLFHVFGGYRICAFHRFIDMALGFEKPIGCTKAFQPRGGSMFFV